MTIIKLMMLMVGVDKSILIRCCVPERETIKWIGREVGRKHIFILGSEDKLGEYVTSCMEWRMSSLFYW